MAVAALLEAVGAPPRLKVHIAGESLLNDGAAIVFFSIFSTRYLAEIGIKGIGEDVGWARGIAIFFHKSLGGVAIGIFFGIGLLSLLFMLDRRFNREENVVQVTATLGVAYLGYYVAEPVWEASGVISTVVTALIVKFFGRGMINDIQLLEDFWTLVEHILNTVLFTLGGAVCKYLGLTGVHYSCLSDASKELSDILGPRANSSCFRGWNYHSRRGRRHMDRKRLGVFDCVILVSALDPRGVVYNRLPGYQPHWVGYFLARNFVPNLWWPTRSGWYCLSALDG